MEVTQMKGDSEAHPFLSTEDEFADFETWDFGNAGSPDFDPKHRAFYYVRVIEIPAVDFERGQFAVLHAVARQLNSVFERQRARAVAHER